ncbi:RHS repeat domain-containing protein [Caulobacter endophyticus]|nr:RHS repeat domain-containing protein [Caulobacter endophyticus]
MRVFARLALATLLTGALTTAGHAQTRNVYGYDAQGRLVEAGAGSRITRYEYDPAGNRTRSASCDVAQPQRKWEAEALPHTQGAATPGGWQMTPANSGIVIYGPYATDIAPGSYVGLWRAKSSQVAPGDGTQSLYIDVWDATAGVTLAARSIPRSAWTAADEYQVLSLAFQVPASAAGHMIELRTSYASWATVTQDWVAISSPTTNANYGGEVGACASAWEGRNLPHAGGAAVGDSWSSSGAANHIVFGPYSTAVPAGRRTAFWQVMIDGSTTGSQDLAELDVFDSTTGAQIARRTIAPSSFSGPGAWHWFSLDYNQVAGHSIEFRIRTLTSGQLIVNRVGAF